MAPGSLSPTSQLDPGAPAISRSADRGPSITDARSAGLLAQFALAADRGWLTVLLSFFAVKQILLVFLLGPFSGHDEVDHYWYIQRLAQGHGLGEVGVVELPPEASGYARYVADYPLNSEVIQPPLYHGMLALVSHLLPSDTQHELYLLRLLSVLGGIVVVWLAYALARTIFPADPVVRIGVPVFVALQPQLAFEAAIVNHDIVIIGLATAGCLVAVRCVRDGLTWQRALTMGMIGTAGLWTKMTFGLVLPVFALAIAITVWPELWSVLQRRGRGIAALVRRAAPATMLALVLPLVLVSPWFIRNYRLYGDPTGATRLQEVSDYALSAMTLPEMLGSPGFWRGRLDDFWGNYGWREIPWDTSLALPVYLVWAVAGLGIVALVVREVAFLSSARVQPVFDAFQRRALALVATLGAMMIVAILYVGLLQFTQSRFAFPAMAGFGMFTVLGFAAWVPARWRWVVLIGLATALIVLNAVVLVRFVIPYYVGPGGGEFVVPPR
ncbi:MAG TPA: hypothetical protein VGT61_04845 [Thermomicrobiales bacterium]|nr:hypothetical protein [Thermomicrobiales bacterium]